MAERGPAGRGRRRAWQHQPGWAVLGRAALGSPPVVHHFFCLQLLEGVSAVAAWLIVLPAAVLWLWASQPGVQQEGGGSEGARPSERSAAAVGLAGAALLHGLLLVARLPPMLQLHARSQLLVADLPVAESAAVLEGMKGLLRSQGQRGLHCASACLLMFHCGVVIMTSVTLADPVTCHGWQLHGNSCNAMVSMQVGVCGVSISLSSMVFTLRLICSRALPWYERHLARLQIKYKVDVREFPRYPYTQSIEDGDALVCTICVDDVRPGELVRTLSCGHRYHQTCIDTWLCHSPTCPMRCHRAIQFEVVRGSEATN